MTTAIQIFGHIFAEAIYLGTTLLRKIHREVAALRFELE